MKVNCMCPICGFGPLAKIEEGSNISGVFVWCRKHKGEVEILNKAKEPVPEPAAYSCFESQSHSTRAG